MTLLQFQELGTSLVELWNLMDSPQETRCRYRHVTNIIAAKENDITSPGVLSLDRMHEVQQFLGFLNTVVLTQMTSNNINICSLLNTGRRGNT